MKVQASSIALSDFSGEGLAIGLFEDQVELTGDLAAIDAKLSGLVQEVIAESEFKGKTSNSITLRVAGCGFKKLLLLGLGKASDFNLETLRRSAGKLAKTARRERCKTLGIALPIYQSDAAATAQAITEGLELALYKDRRFKSDKDETTEIEAIHLLGLAGQEAAIATAQTIASGVFLARELVAAPANVVTPITMA